jgi:plastocyanin
VVSHCRRAAAVCIGLLAAAVCTSVTFSGQTSEAGTITGHVRVTRVRGTALPTNVYAPRAVDRHEAPPTPEIRNVVVYLKGVTPPAALTVTHQEIRQENEAFAPSVLAITRGSTVDFPNGDPFFHNVFSLSSASTFDLGHYRPGDTRSVKFTRAGRVKVYCHSHSHMSASILVLDHPYFATPADNGTFTIADVPPGRYSLVGWHERIGERIAPIDVESGKNTTVELSLPIEDAR